MSGADIAAEVAAAIAEAGAEVGNGSPLTGVIIRPGNVAAAEFACTLVLGQYSARDRDGTNITARDVKATISPDAETDPRNGDLLRVQGRTYSIVHVDAVQPGGVVLMWKCQVRSGDS